eukprot:364445-Chlamydomonas_euryale.AAC.2
MWLWEARWRERMVRERVGGRRGMERFTGAAPRDPEEPACAARRPLPRQIVALPTSLGRPHTSLPAPRPTPECSAALHRQAEARRAVVHEMQSNLSHTLPPPPHPLGPTPARSAAPPRCFRTAPPG